MLPKMQWAGLDGTEVPFLFSFCLTGFLPCQYVQMDFIPIWTTRLSVHTDAEVFSFSAKHLGAKQQFNIHLHSEKMNFN